VNNTLRTALIVLAVLVLAGVIFTAGFMVASANGFGFGWMMGGRGYNSYGPGMMGGNGYNNYGTGMMGGRGNNGYGMMGGYGSNANVTPLSVDQAKTAAEAYLKTLGVDGLQVSEVMVFDNNAYVVVKETSTGNGAFELLVDPVTKTAYPEMGPNMMWNLKYGMMSGGGMMGGRGGGMMGGWNNGNTTPADVSADMPVTQEKAISLAQAYLDQTIPGATAATDPVKFYGYYTMDFEQNGKVAGMLSVNGYSGQVFLHTWHGTFVEESNMK
jgi:hypothetical protein